MSYCPQCAEYEARLTELRDERDQAVLDASEFQDKWDREIDRRQDAESRATAAEAREAKLREALRDVLDTREAEAKATLTVDNATQNFTNPRREFDAMTAAMIAASEAEKRARAALQQETP